MEIAKTCLFLDFSRSLFEGKIFRSFFFLVLLTPLVALSLESTRQCLVSWREKIEYSEDILKEKNDILIFERYQKKVQFVNDQNKIIDLQNKQRISDVKKLISLKLLKNDSTYSMGNLTPYIDIPKEPVFMSHTKKNYSKIHLAIAIVIEFLGFSAGVQAALSRDKTEKPVEKKEDNPKVKMGSKRTYRKLKYDHTLEKKIKECISKNGGKIGYMRLSEEMGIPAHRAKMYLSDYRQTNMN